jgi:hypothetical protein
VSDGVARLGWSTAASSLELGTDKGGYGFGGTGKKSNSKDFKDYGAAYGEGDVIGCCIALAGSGGSIQFTKNGASLGCAYELPAAASFFFPAICLKKCAVDVNFGDRPWKFPPLAGFRGYAHCSANTYTNYVYSHMHMHAHRSCFAHPIPRTTMTPSISQNMLGRCRAHISRGCWYRWCPRPHRRRLQLAYRHHHRTRTRPRRADRRLPAGLLPVSALHQSPVFYRIIGLPTRPRDVRLSHCRCDAFCI